MLVGEASVGGDREAMMLAFLTGGEDGGAAEKSVIDVPRDIGL